MRYHGDHHVLPLFGPWKWAPYMREKNTKMQGPFFLSHTSNLINKSSDMLFQKVQQIYTRLVNMNTFLYFFLSL